MKWITALLMTGLAFGQAVMTNQQKYTGQITIQLTNTTDLRLWASPQGTGTACSVVAPCSLSQAITTAGNTPDRVILLQGAANNPYYLTSTLALTASNSGTAGHPITWQNDVNASPVVSGAKLVTGAWSQDNTIVCADGTNCAWTITLSGYSNFETLFYNGLRRRRVRTTDSLTYLHNANTSAAGVDGGVCVTGANVSAANVACGCPSGGIGGIQCAFTASQNTNGFLCNATAGPEWECQNKFKFTGTDVPASLHGLAIGDVEIIDFEKWEASRMRLSAVDAANHIATNTGPTIPTINQGFLAGHRYLVENVSPRDASAINTPGTWYLDRDQNNDGVVDATWQLIYLAQPGENPNTATIEVPQMSQVMTLNGAHDITFSGITFAHDNWLVGANGLAEQQGMPNVPAAVHCNNCTNVIFTGSTIRNTQGWGLDWMTDTLGTSSGNQFLLGAIYDTGAGGIRTGHGQLNDTGDSNTNVPNAETVQDTLIKWTGQYDPSGIGAGFWVGNAHHITFDQNTIVHSYGSGIENGFMLDRANYTRNFCHDNSYTNNHLYDLMLGISNDGGGIYNACNLSAFSPSGNNGSTPGPQPTLVPFTYNFRIEGNWIHDVAHDTSNTPGDGYNGEGIYFDQGTSMGYVHNNIIDRTTDSCLLNNLSSRTTDTYAQWNLVDNNVMAACGASSQSPHVVFKKLGDNPNALTLTHNVMNWWTGPFAMNNPGHWGCFDNGGTPVACSTRFNFDFNAYFRTASGTNPTFELCSVFAGCGSTGGTYTTYSTLAQWQVGSGLDLNSRSNLNPLFTSVSTGDYTPTADLSAIGWTVFTVANAGRRVTTIPEPTNLVDMFPLIVPAPTQYDSNAGSFSITVAPSPLAFGSVNVGEQSGQQTTIITNTGGNWVNIQSVSLTGGDFIIQSQTCGSVLNQASTCAISIRFAPLSTGAKTGTLTITDNAAGSPHTVSLTGTGVTPTNSENIYCNAGTETTNFSPSTDGPATLPTTCVRTDVANTPSPNAPTNVTAGSFSDLQAKVTAASCGDNIVIPAVVASVRQTYDGGSSCLTIPATVCNASNWITIKSDNMAAMPEFTRVNPSNAGYGQIPGRPIYTIGTTAMPKITCAIAGAGASIKFTAGAKFWRIEGVEITNHVANENLAGLGNSSSTDHVIWDRVLVHPEETTDGKSPSRACATGTRACTEEIGIQASGTFNAVVASYIYDIRRVNTIAADAKGIFFGNGSAGPCKAVNNFVEASDENIFNGGGAASIVGEDCEIRSNHLFKPLFWKKDDASYDGNNYEVKNLFELKNMDRAIIEGNIFENNWTGQGDQDGSAILLTPKNPNATCTVCQDSNITFRYNYTVHATKAFQLAPVKATQGGTSPAGEFNISVHDNVFDDITCAWTSNPGGTGTNCAISTKILSDISNFHDVLFDHNTFITTSSKSGTPMALASVTGDVAGVTWNNFTFTNNISVGGIKGQAVGGGNLGQCGGPNGTGQGAPSYTNLGESAGAGCFTFTPAGNGWCMDGNGLLTAQTNMANANSPYPDTSTHASPHCSATLVGNFTTSNYSTVLFANFNNGNGGDYHLQVTSPFHNKATDGTDIGANIDTLNTKITGVQ